jgi:hypothetical protein
MLWNKKRINTDEYEKLLNKISDLAWEVAQVKNKIEVLNTNYNDLRGKFNRKLNILQKEQQEDAEPEDLKTAFTPFM